MTGRRVIALTAAAFVVGIATARLVAPPTPATNAVTDPHADRRQSSPSGGRAGGIAPGGFAHTRNGAVAAAIAYVRTGQAMLDASDDEAAAEVRAMSADASADAQADELVARLHVLRRTLADATGPVTYRQAALATSVDVYTAERATVSVWHVGVLAADGTAPPQANWAVSRFELVWEHGTWKVWSETITPGPAPIAAADAAPATNAAYDSALAGFEPAP
jgi:hypothetical protein